VKSRMNSTKGLTLIELTVVMCILGVMVLISIPNIGRWIPRYRLRGATRDLASSMQLARLGAIKDNRKWGIVFDINNETYRILSDDGGDDAWGTADDVGFKGDTIATNWQLSTRSLAAYRNVSLGDNGYGNWPSGNPVGDGVTFANDWIEFKPDGTAGPEVNGIVGSVYLRNNRGDAACVRVRFSATGGIEVLHWDGDSWEP